MGWGGGLVFGVSVWDWMCSVGHMWHGEWGRYVGYGIWGLGVCGPMCMCSGVWGLGNTAKES